MEQKEILNGLLQLRKFEKNKVVIRKLIDKEKLLLTKYDKINIHLLYSDRIGELVVRAYWIKKNIKRKKSSRTLDIFLPNNYQLANKAVLKMLNRYFPIVFPTEADFWIYMFIKNRHRFSLNCKEFKRYMNKSGRIEELKEGDAFGNLTPEELEYGKTKSVEMGLQEEDSFVCIAARDSSYLAKTRPEMNFRYHNYRDTDIKTYIGAIEYLDREHIKTVRMGQIVKKRFYHENCIDYAFKYYDELMDLYLSYRCKFFLSDACGIALMPLFFNKPVAMVNAVPLANGWSGIPYSEYTYMIPMRYRDIKTNRIFKFTEMFSIDYAHKFDGIKLKKMGIEVVKNTKEEIYEFVKEFYQRIEGNWEASTEDNMLQERYSKLIRNWCKENHKSYADAGHFKIGTTFLKKNIEMLD